MKDGSNGDHTGKKLTPPTCGQSSLPDNHRLKTHWIVNVQYPHPKSLHKKGGSILTDISRVMLYILNE